jgi:catechol 2,3-dioxygenase-like lactoylglutathione lyase family enzyme
LDDIGIRRKARRGGSDRLARNPRLPPVLKFDYFHVGGYDREIGRRSGMVGWHLMTGGDNMPELVLHHVSIPTRNVERAAAFYRDIFGLRPIPRPDFQVKGAWLACGDRQVHLVQHPGATFRSRGVDNDDAHFAFQTGDFEKIVARLAAHGYREDAGPDDPMRMIIKRQGPAGFAQLYILDPDANVIEVNNAAR